MQSESPGVVTGRDAEGTAIESADPQPIKKSKHWKQFLLTVSAVYPLTLLIPEVLRIFSHVVSPLREAVIRDILATALLVAALMFVIDPLVNRVFKSWLKS